MNWFSKSGDKSEIAISEITPPQTTVIQETTCQQDLQDLQDPTVLICTESTTTDFHYKQGPKTSTVQIRKYRLTAELRAQYLFRRKYTKPVDTILEQQSQQLEAFLIPLMTMPVVVLVNRLFPNNLKVNLQKSRDKLGNNLKSKEQQHTVSDQFFDRDQIFSRRIHDL